MTSRQSLARGVCALIIASLALGACGGSSTPSSAPAAIVVASPTPASPSPSAAPSPSPSLSPTAVPSPALPWVDPLVADLTGVTTGAALAHRLPIAVLIDDNRVARPQSGFNGASIVYQAPADGGETRYMLVFQEGDSSAIGPVRSARIYFVHWAVESDAVIAHYGGDRMSRAYLEAHDHERFTNLDALGAGAKAYHRISSRSAPHNGYTSTAALRAKALALGALATVPADLIRHPFIAPSQRTSLPAKQTIRIPYRTGLIGYHFDPKLDLYARDVDGVAQVDPADGKRVTTRNVVVLFMTFRTDSTIERGHARPVLDHIGTGPAIIFREGRRIDATWSKTDDSAPTRLLDATGAEIPLVTGRTFVQVVPTDTKIAVGS